MGGGGGRALFDPAAILAAILATPPERKKEERKELKLIHSPLFDYFIFLKERDYTGFLAGYANFFRIPY